MDNRESVVVGTSQADVEAAQAVERHHAQMAGRLGVLVGALSSAAVAGDAAAVLTAREELVGWLREDLVPHAVAEEKAMYPAARATVAGRLLVEGMLAEHETITRLVDEVADAARTVRAVAAGYALQVLFESHLRKENELVLPLLVETPGVSVAELLAGMHELLGGEDEHAGEGGCGGHTCGCGEVDGPGYPELDARAVPHAIRHATIFGALDAVRPGGGLVLVAPHDPVPLLAQVEERAPGEFSTAYLERGPEAWRIEFVRREAV